MLPTGRKISHHSEVHSELQVTRLAAFMLVKHDWSIAHVEGPVFLAHRLKWMLNFLARQKKAQPRAARLTSNEGHVLF